MTRDKPAVLVDPGWLEARLGEEQVRVIEIAGMGQEDFSAYRAGHVPGAMLWPWKRMLWDPAMRDFPNAEEFARRLGSAGITNSTTVVIYGEPVQFGVYGWWVLRYCGHNDVRLLDGGRRRWQAEGGRLSQDEAPRYPAKRYRPVRRIERMRIGRDGVLASLAQRTCLLLDARSIEEYSGQRVGAPGTPDVGAERAGRIPGAKHLEYLELLDSNESFKPASEIAAAFASRGLQSGQDIVAYCRGSHRASVLYFALSEILGRDKVRVYDGSWTEWGSMVGMPIET